jgi:hypothetical protein
MGRPAMVASIVSGRPAAASSDISGAPLTVCGFR